MKRDAACIQSFAFPCGRGLGEGGCATPSGPPPPNALPQGKAEDLSRSSSSPPSPLSFASPLGALLRPLVFGVSLALAACATSGPPAPIPPPLAETMPNPPVSPVPEMWQPGHWDWTGSSYVWVPGQYVEATGHGGTWMPGWWEKTDSSWVWHSAHWL